MASNCSEGNVSRTSLGWCFSRLLHAMLCAHFVQKRPQNILLIGILEIEESGGLFRGTIS